MAPSARGQAQLDAIDEATRNSTAAVPDPERKSQRAEVQVNLKGLEEQIKGLGERRANYQARLALDRRDIEKLEKLEKLAPNPDVRVATRALAHQYRHTTVLASPAGNPDLRRRLQSIVEDSMSPKEPRDAALAALMGSQWVGRNDWYLSLFRRPITHKVYEEIVVSWPLQALDTWAITRVKAGRASATEIDVLLGRRTRLQATVGPQLQKLLTGGGEAGGLAAAMIDSDVARSAVLSGADREAERALLAAARRIRLPLSLDAVARFLGSKDLRLGEAAERYLEAEDSPRRGGSFSRENRNNR